MKKTQSGFSLLELLVAFSIMAFSLGALYNASGGSVRNVSDTRNYSRAILLAESVLAGRDDVEASGWNEQGAFQEYQWRVTSTPWPDVVGGVSFHRVSVDVGWQDGQRHRNFELVTLLPQAKAVTP
ncbi:prepilin-type N-terminal cleavage/methylation domain-containing protein [Azoarcus sp. L1K30]|uniref:type IV pilus modification PilV family protein n=1 Tax=Azoarcus sp. L1K30 TaxID=2820277 RepID=UPI001B84089C|nr:prepilin-type N-terminal cleavage/methylation domain-containing protein [Azoarcus sp. L1K30]MBR0567249.1 prepilin-type N-terminal cleavage/methylation domain-containing protein [Azoarcus sp. L1K30]